MDLGVCRRNIFLCSGYVVTSRFTPRLEFVDTNGFKQALHRWDQGSNVTVLFLHGFLDVGLGWSFVVEEMRHTGWNFAALDWRGHGHSDWVNTGGYYHFIDYVRDLENCVSALTTEKLFIVGHSMGAMALTGWLGSTTKKPDGCLLLEALGPMPEQLDGGLTRVRTWLRQLKNLKPLRVYADATVVREKLSNLYQVVPEHRIERIAGWATKSVEGGLTWRYDPLHRTQSPIPIPEDLASAMWESIDIPLLWVGGEKSSWKGERLEKWLQRRPNLDREILPEGAHMLQYECPRAVGQSVSGFIERTL